jgi:hypothetical protein
MDIKLIEIRDHATFVPAMAIRISQVMEPAIRYVCCKARSRHLRAAAAQSQASEPQRYVPASGLSCGAGGGC